MPPGEVDEVVEISRWMENGRLVFWFHTEHDERKSLGEYYGWDDQSRLVSLRRDAYGDDADLSETYTYRTSGALGPD